MRRLSDDRLLPLASCLAMQKGLRLTSVTRRQRDILLDAAEHALREIDARWEAGNEQKTVHVDT